jgi:tetrahydromethanopterin S-methyltransferase subunit G
MSLDESIGKIEVDPKEEASVVEVFQDVLDKLSNKYFEIERDFFNKLGVLIDGDFKFGVLLLVFVRFLGRDTGNLYRNGFL